MITETQKNFEDIEAELKRALGVEKVIWILERKSIDSTDRHIDALVRFVRPSELILGKANEVEEGERATIYKEDLEILSNKTDAKGRPFQINEMEKPDPLLLPRDGLEGDPSMRSYVNLC
ncbi:hypothetical protein ACHAQJ_004605 [Trichoderma viride]